MLLRLCGFAVLAGGLATSAQAQIAVSVAAASNELFRGNSISDESPVLRGSVSMELPAGFFAGASASLAPRRDGAAINASSQYAGWATRQGQLSIEAGVVHRHYAFVSDRDYQPDYFEGFVGISRKMARLRVYLSPDYLKSGRASYYVDAATRLFKLRGVAFDAHGGLSLIPDAARQHRIASYVDASVEANRAVGAYNFSVGMAWTNYPVFGTSNGPRAVATVSRAF